RGVEVIEIAEVPDELLLEQLIDERRAEPLDVHRRPRRKMLEAAAETRGTRRVLASPDDFFLVPTQRAPALLACGGHDPRLGGVGAEAENRRHDFRDYIAGFLEHDGVAFADVLSRDVFSVVKRGHRDGRTGDEHRLEHGVWGDGSGAADVDV